MRVNLIIGTDKMTEKQDLNYVTSNLFEGRASDFGSWSGLTPSHDNLMFHQLILVSSGVLAAGKYTVRIVSFEGVDQLEATVDTGFVLDMTGVNSYVLPFRGAIKGIHLEVDTNLSAGETISCVLSSAAVPFSHQVDWDDISGSQPPAPAHTHAHADTTGKTPNDHHNQVHAWNGPDHTGLPVTFPPDPHDHLYPMIKEVLPALETLTIEVNRQLIVYDNFDIIGALDIQGKLVVI